MTSWLTQPIRQKSFPLAQKKKFHSCWITNFPLPLIFSIYDHLLVNFFLFRMTGRKKRLGTRLGLHQVSIQSLTPIGESVKRSHLTLKSVRAYLRNQRSSFPLICWKEMLGLCSLNKK